jgi:5'-nucleotidase
MRALVTNDDGIDSAGLAVLVRVAQAAGYDVTVAAPAHEYSGASAALFGAEAGGRLAMEEKACPDLPDGVRSLAVRAAPALITFVAAHDGFGPRPDLVLSGVNRGPNTGNAVLHSGTVGAALSAMTHTIPAVAVSMPAVNPRHWGTAEAVTAHVLDWVVAQPPGHGVLNVNVPDVPLAELRGIRKAPLATFGSVSARLDDLGGGEYVLQYDEIDPSRDAASDAGMVAAGWATLTLLRAPCYDEAARLPESLDGPPPPAGDPGPRS